MLHPENDYEPMEAKDRELPSVFSGSTRLFMLDAVSLNSGRIPGVTKKD